MPTTYTRHAGPIARVPAGGPSSRLFSPLAGTYGRDSHAVHTIARSVVVVVVHRTRRGEPAAAWGPPPHARTHGGNKRHMRQPNATQRNRAHLPGWRVHTCCVRWWAYLYLHSFFFSAPACSLVCIYNRRRGGRTSRSSQQHPASRVSHVRHRLRVLPHAASRLSPPPSRLRSACAGNGAPRRR